MLLAGLGALAGCSNIPDHDGYPKGTFKGWDKPAKLELDDDLEAEADGELSYPTRQRARWYAVELPDDGRIEIRLAYFPLGPQVDEELVDDPLDLAFEVYDDSHRLLVRADNVEEDAGERKKTRVLEDLPKGRYLIHLYLQRRLDAVEYNIRVHARSGAIAARTDFPRNVPFLEPLPLVPAVDDAPPPPPKCRGRRCRGNGPRKVARSGKGKPPRRKNDDSAQDAAPSESMRGRITGVRATPDGTRITINRGTSHGVVKGWTGWVVTKSGSSISNGSFTLVQVKASESYATVRASADAVSAAARVLLKP